MPDRVTLPAHAKVNLFLRILARADGGYHAIETLFCRLALADEVTVERGGSGDVTLEVTGDVDTGPVEANLAVRGARTVLSATRQSGGVHVTLRKQIPAGAGLGGGSSDCAAALIATNQVLGDPVPLDELFQMGARLGADVPFFLRGASLALAWGHGDRLFGLPALPPAPVLLLSPPVPVDTREAYGWVDAARVPTGRGALALDADALGDWGSVARMAGNDFESPVFGRLPAVREAFEALVATRPLICRLSGSGSTLFGLYRSVRDREDARSMLGKKFGRVRETETA